MTELMTRLFCAKNKLFSPMLSDSFLSHSFLQNCFPYSSSIVVNCCYFLSDICLSMLIFSLSNHIRMYTCTLLWYCVMQALNTHKA